MKIKIKNNKKKIILISTILIFAFGLVYAGFSYKYQLWPFTKQDNKEIEQNNSDTTNSQTKTDSNKPVEGVDGTKNSSEVPISNTTSLSITSLSQTGQMITYSADITNPSTNGVCSANFTKEGSLPVVRDDAVTSNKCGPFTISANSFDSLGEWTLTLRYFADNVQAVTTAKIEIK